MHRQGHIGVSLIVSGIIFAIVPSHYAIPLIGVVLFTERLPDLDFKIPFIEHRGYSHTIWAAMLIASGIAGGVVGGLIYAGINLPSLDGVAVFQNHVTTFTVLWVGTVIGFCSHFAGDMITVGTGEYGVQPFAPISQWESSIQLWTADDRFGNAILVAGGVIAMTTSVAVKTGFLG